jgi:hypothetical protein
VATKLVTKFVDLTTTNQTTVYTVPANHSAVVQAIILSNTDSTNRNILIQRVTGADVPLTSNIFEARAISSNSSVALVDANTPLFLDAGDVVKATATTSNTLLITLSVEERYDPNKS